MLQEHRVGEDNMNGKRILIISKSLTSGGAERVAANVATHLNQDDNKAWLLVLDGSICTYNTEAPLIDLKMPWAKTVSGKIKWYLKVMRMIAKYKKVLKITHAVSFLSEPDLLNVLTKKYGKSIVSVRNNRSALNRNELSKIKDHFIFNKADRIVALSLGAKEDLVSFYKIKPSKIDVIYNACDAEKIQSMASEILHDVDTLFSYKKIVITAGRLTGQKGQWHLIRAFKLVHVKVPDAKLLILGQGEEKEYLKLLIKELGLTDTVKLMGYHKNPYYYLKRSDIFIFPSLYEGFGNILLEAMACDLPIISTDCIAGPRELLEPGTSYDVRTTDKIIHAKYGVLIPPCDGKRYNEKAEITEEERMMSEAIIEMLLNEELQKKYSMQSTRRIKDFTNESIYKQWLSVMDEV